MAQNITLRLLTSVQQVISNDVRRSLPCGLSGGHCARFGGVNDARHISTTATAHVQLSSILCAEPLKKKKRIDPAVVRAREEKRKRRLEKAIRKLEKSARQLKPITELEVPRHVRAELSERRRPLPTLSGEEADARFDLLKAWTRHKQQQHNSDVAELMRIQRSREVALAELKAESYELYCSAIQMDDDLIPWEVRGPTLTPPIDNYNTPDGDYTDTTRKWE